MLKYFIVRCYNSLLKLQIEDNVLSIGSLHSSDVFIPIILSLEDVTNVYIIIQIFFRYHISIQLHNPL